MTQVDDHRLIDTIAALARDAVPVRPLATPVVRTAIWLGAAVALALPAVAALGVRADVGYRSHDPEFAVGALVLVAVTVVSSGSAMRLGVPGAGHGRLARAAPVLLAVGWGGVLASQFWTAGGFVPSGWAEVAHMTCSFRMAVVGLLPGLALLGMVRAAAPLDLRWAAACAALGAAGLGALGAQFVCADDAAVHLLAWHFLPAVLGTVGVALMGEQLLRPRPWSP